MRARFLLIALLLVLVIALVACASTPAPTPTPVPPTAAPKAVAPTAAPPPAPPPASTPVAPKPAVDVAAIQKAWESGRHNNKYDLGRGPNTMCSRCHSPGNWDPAAKADPPPNCVSCKFPTDKEVRIAKSNLLIAEADWKMVGCYVCHEVKGGVVDPKIAIWNNGTKKYDAVTSTTDLCEKCHEDSIGGSMHRINLGGGAHSNQIGQTVQRPEACTDCHNPHSLKADCKSCHAAAFAADKKIVGHDAAHANVTCVACHDALKSAVGKVEATNIWTTGTFAAGMGGGPPAFTAAYSHEFKKAVANAECIRCHYTNNPWKLTSLVTPTPVPATPTAKPMPSPTK